VVFLVPMLITNNQQVNNRLPLYSKPNNIVFLCSSNGGNLKFFYNFLKNFKLLNQFRIICMADRDCGAMKFANENMIESIRFVHPKNDSSNLIKELSLVNPSLIITTFHKKLDSNFVKIYGEISYNLHYSLLPKHKGLIGRSTVEESFRTDILIGTTLHRINNEIDSGPIIFQSSFSKNSVVNEQKALDMNFKLGCLQLTNLIFKEFSSKFRSFSLKEISEIDNVLITSFPILLSLDSNYYSEIFYEIKI